MWLWRIDRTVSKRLIGSTEVFVLNLGWGEESIGAMKEEGFEGLQPRVGEGTRQGGSTAPTTVP